MSNSLKRIASVFAATVLILAAGGCHRPGQNGHSEWQTIGMDGWAYGDKLIFNADGRDTMHVPQVVIGVRHTDAYPFANLWLEMSYASGDTTVADTVNIPLSDDFGVWYGTGSGVSFQLTHTVSPRRRVNPGSAIRLRHIMRVDTLEQLEQLGVVFS